MKITGLQKLSLVDFDGHIAATIFVSSCNFACPFCHNSRLVKNTEEEIKLDEILNYLEKRKNMLDAVCISGGEPTLFSDLPDMISKIKNLGYIIKLDTNGSNPQMIKYLHKNNLIDYVAMDIKNSLDKYELTAGKCVNLDNIKESIHYLMTSGIDYEFRTTLVSNHHNIDDIKKISKLLKNAKRYYIQKFEDSGECLTDGLEAISKIEVEKYKEILSKTINNVYLRGY